MMVRNVLIPAELPNTISRLETGWSFGWRTIIAAELVFGVAGGLGFFIDDARCWSRSSLSVSRWRRCSTWWSAGRVIRWGMKSGG